MLFLKLLSIILIVINLEAAFANQVCRGSSHIFQEYNLVSIQKLNYNKNVFYYYNPGLDVSECAPALTLEEKVKQQSGNLYSDILKFQLKMPRDSSLGKLLREQSWYEHWLYLNDYKMAALVFLSSKATTREVKKIMYETKALQDELFGTGLNVGQDDLADAFRHFYGISRIASEHNCLLAFYVGHMHEKDDISLSSLMDRYNNQLALNFTCTQKRTRNEILTQFELLKSQNQLGILKEMSGLDGSQYLQELSPDFLNWAQEVLKKRL